MMSGATFFLLMSNGTVQHAGTVRAALINAGNVFAGVVFWLPPLEP